MALLVWIGFDRAGDEFSGGVDDEQRPQTSMKEREAVTSRILIDPAFASARDPAFPHERLNSRSADAETFRNQRGVHAERLAIEFNSVPIAGCHVRSRSKLACRSIVAAMNEPH